MTRKDIFDILLKTSLIGLGEWEKGQPQIKQFVEEMEVGDIVMIRKNGSLALVEVTGTHTYEPSPPLRKYDWFEHRREIKVLALCASNQAELGTLPKGILKSTLGTLPKDEFYRKTLKPAGNSLCSYIDKWLNQIGHFPQKKCC